MSDPIRTDDIQGKIVHVYDGIEEADNNLPNWWLWTLYGAILFAACYWFYYHSFGIGKSPLEAYGLAKMEAMNSGGEITDSMLDGLSKDKLAVAAGKEIYNIQCVACHGSNGEGKIGPNLTDEFWIHGGAPTAIYATMMDGVAAKGMPAWGETLGPGTVKQVAAYVLTIRDTNVAGKAPQGDKWDPAAAPADNEPATTP